MKFSLAKIKIQNNVDNFDAFIFSKLYAKINCSLTGDVQWRKTWTVLKYLFYSTRTYINQPIPQNLPVFKHDNMRRRKWWKNKRLKGSNSGNIWKYEVYIIDQESFCTSSTSYFCGFYKHWGKKFSNVLIGPSLQISSMCQSGSDWRYWWPKAHDEKWRRYGPESAFVR